VAVIFRTDIITLPAEIHNFVKKRSQTEVGLNIFIEYSVDNLKDLLDILISKGIALSHLDWTKVVNGRLLLFTVIDLERSTVSLEDLISLIKDKEYVLEVTKADEFLDKFIYSRHLFPILIGDDRVVAIGPPMMEGIILYSRELLGEAASANLLYHIGYAMGKSLYEYLRDNVDRWELEDGMRFLDAVFSSYGWGRLKSYVKNGDKIIINVEDLWECEVYKDSNEEPKASLFEGCLAGFFEQFYEKRVIVRHTGCTVCGDEYCIFEVILP